MAVRHLRALVPSWRQALNCEIAAAQRDGGDRYQLSDGEWLLTSSDGHVYRFRLDRACFAPEECGVTVGRRRQASGVSVRGSIVCIEGQEIVLRLDQPLNEQHLDRQWTMTVELWFILERLRDRLHDSCIGAPKPGERLFSNLGSASQAGPATTLSAAAAALLCRLNAEQRVAAVRSLEKGSHFVWGPPGTGKTRTVGHAAALAASQGQRVLLVAYSNVALDVAALAAAVAAQPDIKLRAPGSVLRIGTPRLPAVADHPTLTTLAVLRKLRPQLVRQLDELRKYRKRLIAQRRSSPRHKREGLEEQLRRIRDKLQELRSELQAEEDRLTRAAQIVGCTLARLATSDLLAELTYDLVILDEASMASIPFAALAGIHATRTLIYAGDFRQLPPIVLAEDPVAKQWLGNNVFDHAGITGHVQERHTVPACTVMLAEQYRMHPAIADKVSRTYYYGRLKTAPEVLKVVDRTTQQEPYPRESAMVVDVSDLGPFCRAEPREFGYSRFNLISALVALILAHEARVDVQASVGIISPYRAQARLLRCLASELGMDEVITSTVHRFQGGEVDVAILDLTVSFGKKEFGRLLDGDTWSAGGRLLNVAISRPKGKLLIVADCRYLDNQWSRTPTTAAG